MMNKTQLTVILALSLLAPAWAVAQPPLGPRGHDRVRTFLVLRLTEELNLSDEKALQVSRIIRESDDQRRALRENRTALEGKLRDAVKAASPDAGEMQQLITQANEIDEKLAMVPEQSIREMQKLLTLEQQAKLALFRPELQQQIRSAVRRRLRRQAQ